MGGAFVFGWQMRSYGARVGGEQGSVEELFVRERGQFFPL